MISNMDMLSLDLEVYDIPATYNDEADFLDDDWSMNIHTMASHSAPLSPLPPGTVMQILPPPLPELMNTTTHVLPPPLPMQPPPLPTDDN